MIDPEVVRKCGFWVRRSGHAASDPKIKGKPVGSGPSSGLAPARQTDARPHLRHRNRTHPHELYGYPKRMARSLNPPTGNPVPTTPRSDLTHLSLNPQQHGTPLKAGISAMWSYLRGDHYDSEDSGLGECRSIAKARVCYMFWRSSRPVSGSGLCSRLRGSELGFRCRQGLRVEFRSRSFACGLKWVKSPSLRGI